MVVRHHMGCVLVALAASVRKEYRPQFRVGFMVQPPGAFLVSVECYLLFTPCISVAVGGLQPPGMVVRYVTSRTRASK